MRKYGAVALLAIVVSVLPLAGKDRKGGKDPKLPVGPIPVAVLDGGRRVDFMRFLSTERDLHTKRSFFNKFVDFVAGSPEWRQMLRPYGIATDSHGRILITDPGTCSVHIFDLQKNKYTSIDGSKKEKFHSPIGIAVDDADNFYVTDSELGKVFAFDSGGKFLRVLGDIKGEGFFKRATGIAFDRASQHLYISDTLRDRVYVTDLNGQVLKFFGTRGSDPGQFNFPTQVVVNGDEVFVVDTMNFRVQSFDKNGKFRSQFGGIGDRIGNLFRPKGLAVDSYGQVYIVDASLETVQVFDRQGQLLYSFGHTGTGVAGFELPAGVWVDGQNQIYVADSYNHRVQIFRFVNAGKPAGGRE